MVKLRYLLGPACASACETFSYAASLAPNVTIVGQYPSQGLGGGVQDFLLPEGLRFRFTVNRSLDEDFEIHIEGNGVVPDVQVPVNEETLFSEEDVILQTAVNHLQETLTTPFTVGDALQPGDSTSGTLTAGERIRHPIIGPAARLISSLTWTRSEPVILRVYSESGELLVEAAQSTLPNLPLLSTVAGETLIVEVSTANDNVSADYSIDTTLCNLSPTHKTGRPGWPARSPSSSI